MQEYKQGLKKQLLTALLNGANSHNTWTVHFGNDKWEISMLDSVTIEATSSNTAEVLFFVVRLEEIDIRDLYP